MIETQRDAIVFIIYAEPTAKGRPRFSRGRTYTPRRTKKYEERVAEIARKEMGDKPPVKGAIKMTVSAYFQVPSSWPNWKQQAAQTGLLGHTHRPDLDNLGKSISDALNGIVYEDDSQIVEMNIKKGYAYRNLIEVEIMPLRLHSANQVQRDDVA